MLKPPPCKTFMLRNTHMRDDSSGDKNAVVTGLNQNNTNNLNNVDISGTKKKFLKAKIDKLETTVR